MRQNGNITVIETHVETSKDSLEDSPDQKNESGESGEMDNSSDNNGINKDNNDQPIQNSTNIEFEPLFSADTEKQEQKNKLENDISYTYFGGRVRVRHARESAKQIDPGANAIIGQYLKFPSFYFEKRTFQVEVIDKTKQGVAEVTFKVTTRAPMSDRLTGRFFYSGIGSLNDYHMAGLFTPDPERPNSEDAYHYTYTIRNNALIMAGNIMEFEITFIFLNNPSPRGAPSYYSRAWHLALGEPGLKPWKESDQKGSSSTISGFLGTPLTEESILGGDASLSSDVSEEPELMLAQMAPNIAPENAQNFVEGRRLFHTNFIDGTHSDPRNEPIETAKSAGPSYISESCISCHINNGRGLPPQEGNEITNMVFKLGSVDTSGQIIPHAKYGKELQTQGQREGSVTVQWEYIKGTYGDGEEYELRKPMFNFSDTEITSFSPRAARPIIGVGLIEALDETVFLDKKEGISGKANLIKDPNTGKTRIGRFGWKSERYSLKNQVAGAFKQDMGVTSNTFPDPAAPNSEEISDESIDKVVSYLANLGVPPRRNASDVNVIAGEAIFSEAGCVSCHSPRLETGPNHPFAILRNQTIHPYSDFLLHDMGPDLADNLGGEGLAKGNEWRTPPLWGLGLTKSLSTKPLQTPQSVDLGNQVESYLHDGRARSLPEAILWHGGQAEFAKEYFKNTLNSTQRSQLIDFLKSL